MVDLARLKTCENSAELGYPGLAEVYVRATGDLEGRFTKPIPKVLCASWGKGVAGDILFMTNVVYVL